MSTTHTDATLLTGPMGEVDPEVQKYVHDLVDIVDQPLIDSGSNSEGSAEGLDNLLSAAAELARIALLDEASRALIHELAEDSPIKEDLDGLVDEAETYVDLGYDKNDPEAAEDVLQDLTNDFLSTWAQRTASKYMGPIDEGSNRPQRSKTSDDSTSDDSVEGMSKGGDEKHQVRLPSMKTTYVVKRLTSMGFEATKSPGKVKGSHVKFVHPDGRQITVPVGHKGDIHREMLRGALKRSGIPEQEFLEL